MADLTPASLGRVLICLAVALNEHLAARIGASVAEGPGISLEGLGRGVGAAAEGIGGMVRKLFGR